MPPPPLLDCARTVTKGEASDKNSVLNPSVYCESGSWPFYWIRNFPSPRPDLGSILRRYTYYINFKNICITNTCGKPFIFLKILLYGFTDLRYKKRFCSDRWWINWCWINWLQYATKPDPELALVLNYPQWSDPVPVQNGPDCITDIDMTLASWDIGVNMVYTVDTETFESSVRSSVAKPEPPGAETFARSRSQYLKFMLWLSAPGRTKVVYFLIIHFEQDQASDLNRYSFQKKSWNSTFYLKDVQRGAY
jgi:hypothetical protein